jgi:hypothetical protein
LKVSTLKKLSIRERLEAVHQMLGEHLKETQDCPLGMDIDLWVANLERCKDRDWTYMNVPTEYSARELKALERI